MAEEELLLLEGLTLYGFGNWPDIADHVGTKSEDECFEHYAKLYAGPTLPIPLDTNAQLPPMPLTKIDLGDHCRHRKSNKKTQTSNPIKAELGGYMPQRHEFEVPYNDQAESPVASVKFSENDTAEERQIKMDVLTSYHCMLQEREKRSDFIVDRKLLKWKVQQKFQRTLPYEEDRRMLQRLRPILQVMERDRWDALVDGMLKETSLRRAIAYYGDLRRDGIRTEREVDDYYARARKRGKYQTRRDQPSGPPAIYDGPTSLAASSAGSSANSKRYQNVAVLQPVDMAALRNLEILGQAERRLAADLYLTPDEFLRAKEAMMREYCRAGFLGRSDVKNLTPVDGLAATLIYDFLVENNWVRRSE